MKLVRALTGRAGCVMVDQGLSSICNFLLSTVVASNVSAVEFGSFAVAFATYSLAVAVAASMSSQVIAIRFAGAPVTVTRQAVGTAVGLTIVVGLVCSAAGVGVALASSGPIYTTMLAFAVVVPGLLVQECWRAVFVACGTPRKALANNVCWSVVLSALLGALTWRGVALAWPYVVAWGVAAAVAAAFGTWQARQCAVFRGLRRWLVEHRDLVAPILLSTAATLGATQVATVLVASLSSLETVGAVRGAQTLLGPVGVVAIAAAAFVTPEVSRRVLTRRQLVFVAIGMSAGLVLITMLWGGALIALPPEWGERLLGDTWDIADLALPGIALNLLGIASIAGATTVLRARGRAGLALASSVLLGAMILVLPAIGVVTGGASGAAYGFGLAALIVVLPTWLLFIRGFRPEKRGALGPGRSRRAHEHYRTVF